MRRVKLSISTGPGDFMPLVIGGAILVVSLPAFVLMLLDTEQFTGVLGFPVKLILLAGALLGLAYFVIGLQTCTQPGSLIYRLAHGRIFKR